MCYTEFSHNLRPTVADVIDAIVTRSQEALCEIANSVRCDIRILIIVRSREQLESFRKVLVPLTADSSSFRRAYHSQTVHRNSL